MGKLDTIYKVFRAMNSKKSLSGNSEIIVNKNGSQIVLLKGNYIYDIKNDLGKIDGVSTFDLKSISGTHKLDGELKISDFLPQSNNNVHKLINISTLIKIFSDLKVEEINNTKILNAKLDKIFYDMKEGYLENSIPEIDYALSGTNNQNLKTVIDLILNELFTMDYNYATLKAYLNNNSEITLVKITVIGTDEFTIDIAVNY